MSILAPFFRFFPRTRGEEQHVKLRIIMKTGAATWTLAGNSSFVKSIAYTATGKYLVTLTKAFPYLVSAQASVLLDGAPSDATTVNIFDADWAAGTFNLAAMINDAPGVLAANDEIHVDLHFAANSASFA